MKLLAIETATGVLGCALFEDGNPVVSFSLVAQQRHAEVLMPAIDHICRFGGVAVGDIEAVAVDNGPGLFSGLRVGLATAYAIGSARHLPVVGVSSLDALAHNVHWREGLVASVLDARRGEVFWALYRGDGSRLEQLRPPAVAAPDALADELAALGQGTAPVSAALGERPGVLAVGDGAWRYRELLASAGAEVAGPGEMWPSALVVAELAWQYLSTQGRPEGLPAPVYLRQADVRIGWEALGGRVGPIEAGTGPAAGPGSLGERARLGT
ncbi:MAG: tRNA (adenosine(37)-N6)-threonylcarbamoyltransferase complex dimerization subunit type 1 TsaB [Actinobacteria bacterium]|nr:tRNA (adenosine(37)-N6)-threonylcarbamoyltransferase complex dimerization subunit type 1 TsaB [Actinomycetota bacterium]